MPSILKATKFDIDATEDGESSPNSHKTRQSDQIKFQRKGTNSKERLAFSFGLKRVINLTNKWKSFKSRFSPHDEMLDPRKFDMSTAPNKRRQSTLKVQQTLLNESDEDSDSNSI